MLVVAVLRFVWRPPRTDKTDKTYTFCEMSVRVSSWETGRFHEYGLYTKTKSGQYLLWVGVWPDFSEQHPYPVSIGVEHASDKDERLRKAFRTAWPTPTVEFGGHTVGWFAREIIESDDPGKRMLEQLVPVMNKLAEVAALRTGVGAGRS
jgi:hypothetical protein